MTSDVVAAYLDNVSDLGLEAVERSCQQFSRGLVEGRNNSFMPSAAELAANARTWQEAIALVETSRALAATRRIVSYPIGTQPKPPLEPLGPTKMEIAGMMVDTSEWSFAEKEEAFNTGRLPKSRQIGAGASKRITAPVRRA